MDEARRVVAGEHLDPDEAARDRRGLGLGDPGERRGEPERLAVAEHRDRAGEGGRVGGDAGDAATDPVGERRDRRLLDGERRVRGGEAAIRLERAEQLLEVERVAAARGMEGAHSGVVGRGVARPRHLRDGAGGQRPRRDPRDARQRAQLVELLGGGARLPGPHRDDERHGEVGQAPADVAERPHRRIVDPVQVVDDDEQGGLGREVGGQPVDRVEHREARFGAPAVRLGAGRDDPGRRPGGAGEQCPALLLRCAREDGLEQLADGAERELALELAPARGEDAHARAGGLAPRGCHELALADSGCALDERHAPVSGTSVGEHLAELPNVGFALQQVGIRPARQALLQEKFRVAP